MADIHTLNGPTPADPNGEPDHYVYRVDMRDGTFQNFTGYLIMTAAVCAVCQNGYVHFAAAWDQVRQVAKLETFGNVG